MSRTLIPTRVFQAAAMLAEGVDVTEVARQFGVSRKTVYEWSKTPEAQAVIAEITASVRAGVKHLAIANKVRRLHMAQEMVDGIDGVIADRKDAATERAAGKWDAPMPGERTGHVAVKVGYSPGGQPIKEASFDGALHTAKARWLEYAAKELGDIETRVGVKHSGTVSHDHAHRVYDFSAFTPEEQDTIADLARKYRTGAGVG